MATSLLKPRLDADRPRQVIKNRLLNRGGDYVGLLWTFANMIPYVRQAPSWKLAVSRREAVPQMNNRAHSLRSFLRNSILEGQTRCN
jgi:hypothetical protein